MSDLLQVLPDFDVKPYAHLTHSLEKNEVTVIDLISLEPLEIARRCPLPLQDLRQFTGAIVTALQQGLEMFKGPAPPDGQQETFSTRPDGDEELDYVKTLDTNIDGVLGGGLPVGYITEIVGESAAGKTQFIVGLLLSVQLPPPHGLGKSAIYIGTEAPLHTLRLQQILQDHPQYQKLEADQRPSLSRIHSMTLNNMEIQQQVIEHHLPVAADRYDAGLIVLDSVAANFRADHETATAAGLADRAVDLIKLGACLRKLATEKKLAVVVANQVSDRFADNLLQGNQEQQPASSPASSFTAPSQPSSAPSTMVTERNAKMSLDYQQRFFTGWGDKEIGQSENLKTPALGLSWSNQLDARMVLKVQAESYHRDNTTGRKRRRFMSLVFAPWTSPTIRPLEYSIELRGIVSVRGPSPADVQDPALLNDDFWNDADEEFP